MLLKRSISMIDTDSHLAPIDPAAEYAREFWAALKRVGPAKVAAFSRWCRAHLAPPDLDPRVAERRLDALMVPLTPERESQLREYARLLDEEPAPEIAAAVAKAVAAAELEAHNEH